MTMLRAVASALVLVGGLILLLALIGLAGGELDAALAGVLGLALLAVGLVLFNRAGRRRGGYHHPATGEPAGLYGSGTYGMGAGADHSVGGRWGDSGDSGPGDSGSGWSGGADHSGADPSGGGWSGGDSGGWSGGGDSGGGGSC
ncbi:hypothetical protein ACH4OY_19705 [Micromonospora rubida]|uniref:Uncharacterized protein n=1 Tax=Micromonospora rubida TaxID=2697657 RepID=A0ABW7SSF0_9ACTN